MYNFQNKTLQSCKELVNDSTIIQSINMSDVKKILEMLNMTEDIELQVKFFSILAVHVISNKSSRDEIITNNFVFDKIYNVLSRGLPLKTAKTLNFISALLYGDEEEGASRARSVGLRARHSLRARGCLALMAGLFTTTMLHQETWTALCHCLAESCRDCFENQSYCSHLVPLCIQKCVQNNLDALSTLKSLVNNHSHNTKLFFDSNGILIFRRKESLQQETTMQFLSLVIQQAPKETLNLLHDMVYENLEHYKIICGARTKIGQWAIVNLYHLNSRMKENDNGVSKGIPNSNAENAKICGSIMEKVALKPDDTAQLIQNVFREIQLFNAKNPSRDKIPLLNYKLVNSEQEKPEDNHEDMPTLKQIQPKNSKNMSYKKLSTLHKTNHIKSACEEMSFSFLLKRFPRNTNLRTNKRGFNESNLQATIKTISKSNSICTRIPGHTVETRKSLNISATEYSFSLNSTSDDPSLLDFKPIFVSTPKLSTPVATLSKSIRTNKTRPMSAKKIYKRKEKRYNSSRQTENSRGKLQRSMSTRLFDAINDSCTTFVKTFKNIFRGKKNCEEKEESTMLANEVEKSCSYSFTNYMRKRDAILSTDRSLEKSTINVVNNTKFCKTCNDTGSLKRKVDDNSYLKDTVRKLKLGINLYGCDFKKISRALWPRETYMTPEVLYNLYRKLIVK